MLVSSPDPLRIRAARRSIGVTGVSLRMVRGNLVMNGSIGWKIKHDMETTLATDRML